MSNLRLCGFRLSIAPRTTGVLASDEVAVGVVSVCGFVRAADAANELVGGIVAHGGADAVLRLGRHVADRVVGIALALSVAAGKACELAQRVISKHAYQSRAVLGAALARHAPGEVVGILQREIIRARGGLTDQIAHFVVSVDGIFLCAIRADSAAEGVIAVLRRCPVDSLDGDQTVHVVIGILDRRRRTGRGYRPRPW